MCDSCMQPPKEPKFIAEWGTQTKTRFGLSEDAERNERLAKQEEIDRMEKELHDYYGINGEHNEPKKPVSRDQLIARIQQFDSYLSSVLLEFVDDETPKSVVAELVNKHHFLFKEVLSEFIL